jgi:hypothetical protein
VNFFVVGLQNEATNSGNSVVKNVLSSATYKAFVRYSICFLSVLFGLGLSVGKNTFCSFLIFFFLLLCADFVPTTRL